MSEAKAIKQVMDNTRKWERAFTRYIESLKRLDVAKENPDGRAAAAARRSVRVARWNLESVGKTVNG